MSVSRARRRSSTRPRWSASSSGIIRLVEPEPLHIAGRTVLVLEYVGDERDDDAQGAEGAARPRRREETVARQLREHGRLPVDQLEAYGDYLFGAVDFLEGEGVWHRDIKPDNIAVRVRPNRTRELVLIDFSLAGYPAKNTDAGTDGYLAPFVDVITRGSYDSHAERYAVAVTLHQMASGELPNLMRRPRSPPARHHGRPLVARERRVRRHWTQQRRERGINRTIKFVAHNAFGFRNTDSQRLWTCCVTTRRARGHPRTAQL